MQLLFNFMVFPWTHKHKDFGEALLEQFVLWFEL